MNLGEALKRMPPNFYLKCGVEIDDESDAPFISAVIMETPPEEGWPSLAAYFNNPGYREDSKRLELHRFDDAARVGISTEMDNPEAFNRLLIGMIERRWPANDRQAELPGDPFNKVL
jgi:hypothetical protein